MCRDVRRGPWLAFTPDWFRRRQRLLVRLLNAPLVGALFRCILGIGREECPAGARVLGIGPSWYAWQAHASRTVLVSRTSPRYAIRLYRAFRPLWWGLHWWDQLVASRLSPQWSFGFDVLVAYPDPDPEQTTVDGHAFRYSISDWTTLRNGAGTGASDSLSGAQVVLLQTFTTPWWYGMHRGILLFDTSAIGSNSVIDEAHLDLWCTDKYTALGDTSVDLVGSWPKYNTQIVPDDYQNVGATLFGQLLSIANVTLDQYNRITLNSSGIGAINKTGITKLGLRLGWDRSNSPPAFAPQSLTYLTIRFAESSGTDKDPRLTVVYTPPVAYKSGSESPTASLAEVVSGHAQGSASETVTGSAADAATMSSTAGASDSAYMSVVEPASVLGSISAGETAVLSVTEQADAGVLVDISVTDEGVVSPTESAWWDFGVMATESVTGTIADVVVSVAGAVNVTESALGALDEYGLGYHPVGSADAPTIGLVEQIDLVKVGRERYVGLFSGGQEISGAGYERKMVVLDLQGGVVRNLQAAVWGPLPADWGACDRVGLFYQEQGGWPVMTARTVWTVNMSQSKTYRIPKGAIRFAGALLDTPLADQIVPDESEEFMIEVLLTEVGLPSPPETAMRVGEGYRRTA